MTSRRYISTYTTGQRRESCAAPAENESWVPLAASLPVQACEEGTGRQAASGTRIAVSGKHFQSRYSEGPGFSWHGLPARVFSPASRAGSPCHGICISSIAIVGGARLLPLFPMYAIGVMLII